MLRMRGRALLGLDGRGVVVGEIIEHLYRDIRALRIYEGATEVQKLIIARELLDALKANDANEFARLVRRDQGYP